jgi:hypothetical protein
MTQSAPTLPTGHPLGLDLAAILEFGCLTDHDFAREARAAAAMYDDVCWRAAMIPLPYRSARAVDSIEQELASLLKRYLAGESTPDAFWSGFGASVALLDERLVQGLVIASGHTTALADLRRLREQVATANLAPAARQTVQVALELMDAEAAALVDGKLVLEDFQPIYNKVKTLVESALEAPASNERDDERLRDLSARAFATPPPTFLDGPIAKRLLSASTGLRDGRAPDPKDLDALEALLNKAERFRTEHEFAAARLARLSASLQARPLSHTLVHDATQQLAALSDLVALLDTGTLQPDAFDKQFAAAANVLQELLERGAAPTIADLAMLTGEATPSQLGRRIAEVRVLAADTGLPPFIASTVRELLDLLEPVETGLYGASPDLASAQTLIAQVEACLAFGHEVVREETLTLHRFQDLEDRVHRATPNPLLECNLDDALGLLRGMLTRLHGGMYPPASFHRDFAGEAARLELLLSWQTVLDTAAQRAN